MGKWAPGAFNSPFSLSPQAEASGSPLHWLPFTLLPWVIHGRAGDHSRSQHNKNIYKALKKKNKRIWMCEDQQTKPSIGKWITLDVSDKNNLWYRTEDWKDSYHVYDCLLRKSPEITSFYIYPLQTQMDKFKMKKTGLTSLHGGSRTPTCCMQICIALETPKILS